MAFMLVSCLNSSDPGEIKRGPVTPGMKYIVFGGYAGFCPSNCATLYKMDLTNGVLYVNRPNRFYPGQKDVITFSEVVSDTAARKLAYNLIDAIPQSLQGEVKEAVYGCPDCADQGGKYLEFELGEDIYKFNIDNTTNALPTELQEYNKQFYQVLDSLRVILE